MICPVCGTGCECEQEPARTNVADDTATIDARLKHIEQVCLEDEARLKRILAAKKATRKKA